MTYDHIPMGFQYYRAPTPAPSEWEKDLSRLASDGYDTVKLWLQWRWNEPEEGVYDFSDIDELMRLCVKYKLKAVLNLILDVTPVWLDRKYPDAAMITVHGVVLRGYAPSYRQIGGAPGPCFHHEEARRLRIEFIRACAARYADHPALLMWDVWNEPELTVGLLRKPVVGDLVCCCENSCAAFRRWLARRYGNISKLNQVWGRRYRSFEDVEIPRTVGTTADMIDWREFFCDTITEEFRMRVDTVKEFDRVHPVMCHTVPMPIFNAVSCCSDDFAIGAYGDLVGNSVGSDPMAADLLKSAAKGKPMINSEIHAAYGMALNGFHIPDESDLVRHIFIPLAHGSRGFLFWQYRPETLGNEAPAWGHSALDGGDTEWNRVTRDLFALLRRHEREVLSCPPARHETAVYVDRANEIYAWDAAGSTDLTAQSMAGAYQLLYRSGYAVDFLCADDLDNGLAAHYKSVYFPAVFLFDSGKVERIREYVEQGGTVIIESLFGFVDRSTGRHCFNLPGCGMAELLGKKVDKVYSASMIANGYDGIVLGSGNRFEAVTDAGERLIGEQFFVTYTGDEGQVLARTDDGRPAICSYNVGKGRIIDVSTLLSLGFIRTGAPGSLSFIRRIIGEPARFPEAPLGLHCDYVGNADGGLLVLHNTTGEEQTVSVPTGMRTGVVYGRASSDGTFVTVQPGQAAVAELY